MNQRRRFRAPPMEGGSHTTSSPSAPPKLRVDERVVRQMLRVNPTFREGRTTVEVKQALENGSALPMGHAAKAPMEAPAAPQHLGGGFAEAVGFFMDTKAKAHAAQVAVLAEKKKALEDESQALDHKSLAEVVRFVAMLDARVVAREGLSVLGSYQSFLKSLGVSPAQLMALISQAQEK